MVDELSGSKGSRDIANLPYFSESVDLDLILAGVVPRPNMAAENCHI